YLSAARQQSMYGGPVRRRTQVLTQEQDERLSRVGRGTPMGGLLRRYWYPIAVNSELVEEPVKKVRLLGEDLVLYRDRSGRLGLIAEACTHWGISMAYGIPEDEGLRCPYHGWRFDHTGRCVEQPLEDRLLGSSSFRDACGTTAYPVQELSGLIFAYVGPAPAPLLPRWELLVKAGMVHSVSR